MKPELKEPTVFILSAGEDTTAQCEEALKQQDCTFRVKHIKDTFPMHRAFQRMPDECETKYFIQVDSDIILKPHAVRTLFEGIKNTSFMRYMAFGQLYEEGFGVGGSVRCWKKGLFRFFRYRDCRTVDRDLYRRVRRFGLRAKNLDQVLGLHIARHSPFSNYLKTKSDVEKWRFLDRRPEMYALNVLNKNMDNLPASCRELLGAFMGVLTAKERLIHSKNIRIEEERYNRLLCLLGITDNDTGTNELPVTKDNIRDLFSRAYDDFDYKDPEAKTALADIIIKLFGSRTDIETAKLIEIAHL